MRALIITVNHAHSPSSTMGGRLFQISLKTTSVCAGTVGGAVDVAGSGDWGGISGLFSGATTTGSVGLGGAASPVFLR